MKHLIILFATIAATNFAIAQSTDLSKSYFVDAKQQLESMLNGKEAANYEKAIFIIENAWYGNQIDQASFDYAIDSKISAIKQLIKDNYDDKVFKKDMNSLHHKPNAKELYNKALTNWAIYTYITNRPYTYSFADPMATEDWLNSQVVNLNNTTQGNCFALASLFKILSNRLNSYATLCTAPSHIYISHEDEKGTSYNIELGSRKFPGTGTLATLTHSTMESIRSKISLRRLSEKQSVSLCLVYLAKGYEHKFKTSTDDFILQCAETTLKYDDHNLNAMLLKAEYLENKLTFQQKTVLQLQTQNEFREYQALIAKLYNLGYKEIPFEMKNQLIKGWSRDTIKSLADINYKSAGLSASQLLQSRKASLSWGLFDEEFVYKPIERYGNTLFDCKSKRIKEFAKEQNLYNDYNFDPVVFAWNIDPLFKNYTSLSPYTFVANSPIMLVDPDGQKLTVAQNYMGDFQHQLISAFGPRAVNDFGLDKENRVVFTGDPTTYSKEENDILSPLLTLLTNEDNVTLIYDKYFSSDVIIHTGAISTDGYGGEGTVHKSNTDIDIYVDPKENADVETGDYTSENFYVTSDNKLTMDKREAARENGVPKTSEKTYRKEVVLKETKYERTFHGLGHAIGKDDKSMAITLQNSANKVRKQIKVKKDDIKTKSDPGEQRSYDKYHPKK